MVSGKRDQADRGAFREDRHNGLVSRYPILHVDYRVKNTVRCFVRGDRGLVGEVATRIAGRSDPFAAEAKTPFNGISYVTCHDG